MPQPSVAPTTQASFASNLAGLILRHMLVFDFLNCPKGNSFFSKSQKYTHKSLSSLVVTDLI